MEMRCEAKLDKNIVWNGGGGNGSGVNAFKAIRRSARFFHFHMFVCVAGILSVIVIVLIMVAVVIIVVVRGRSYASEEAINSNLKTHIGFNRSLDFDIDPDSADARARLETDGGKLVHRKEDLSWFSDEQLRLENSFFRCHEESREYLQA